MLVGAMGIMRSVSLLVSILRQLSTKVVEFSASSFDHTNTSSVVNFDSTARLS